MYTHTDGTQYATGAIFTEKHPDVPSIGRSSKPFDWSTTFQVPELVTKDQGQSGSCGGQATAYREEILEGVPQSAKSIYSLCFVPGGGSGEQGLWGVIKNTGVSKESDVPSYDNGQPPSEAFMEDTSWNRKFSVADSSNVVYVNLDIESIAEAVRDNNGIILGIYGSDNGTWLSSNPSAPTIPTSQCWCHWVFVGGVGMFNGKKAIRIKNSWGSSVGENGWQWLTEDYAPYFWTAWTFLDAPKPQPKFQFTKDLSYKMTDPDVGQLQLRLGLSTPTNYFGAWTLLKLIYLQYNNGLPLSGKVDQTTRNFLNK